MDAGYIVTGVTSALVAIIVALGAILKFYLPKLRNNPSNHEELVEIRCNLQEFNRLMVSRAQMTARDHQDAMAALQRVENKFK